MMGKVERVLFWAMLAILAVLLVAMVLTDTLANNSADVYRVSVLVRSPSERFVKGLEQAALDYNVDLHMVMRYAESSSQQLDYLEREVANGTDAVIINPEDMNGLTTYYLDSLYTRPSVVTVGQEVEDSILFMHVGVDEYEMGKQLGGWVQRDMDSTDENNDCLILCPIMIKRYVSERRDGIKDVLQANGTTCWVRYCASGDGSIARAIRDHSDATIVVTDESILLEVCETANKDTSIYGVGFAAGVRAYLENGRISGLIMYNDYDAGYISVREALAFAKRGTIKESIYLQLYEVHAGNMYEEPLVQVLFPIG